LLLVSLAAPHELLNCLAALEATDWKRSAGA
jgi:hypothetical protein